jgi:SAM-dependent methyltransferase
MERSELKKYTEANRAAWNEVIPLHQKAAKEKWDGAFTHPGYVCLKDNEVDLLKHVGIEGRSVAHLCCNNGIELLSLKNLGASECVGFDISDEAVKEAGDRATLCHIDCRFVRTDVFDIGPEYNDRFDMIYVSAGGLGWLPDLKLFFGKASTLLRSGGVIFIHEVHPFSEMLPFDDLKEGSCLKIIDPYFVQGAIVDTGGLDYIGNSQYNAKTTQYWFVHKLSDILMGMIGNGVAIEHFSEYEADISAGHKRIEDAKAGVPLSMILVGRKQSG